MYLIQEWYMPYIISTCNDIIIMVSVRYTMLAWKKQVVYCMYTWWYIDSSQLMYIRMLPWCETHCLCVCVCVCVCVCACHGWVIPLWQEWKHAQGRDYHDIISVIQNVILPMYVMHYLCFFHLSHSYCQLHFTLILLPVYPETKRHTTVA